MSDRIFGKIFSANLMRLFSKVFNSREDAIAANPCGSGDRFGWKTIPPPNISFGSVDVTKPLPVIPTVTHWARVVYYISGPKVFYVWGLEEKADILLLKTLQQEFGNEFDC
jgi:hypothetical protein